MPAQMATPKPDLVGVVVHKRGRARATIEMIPFDVWSDVVAHLRETCENPRSEITRMMLASKHFRDMFEIFLYDKLELEGPHNQHREDVIMHGWKPDLVIWRIMQLFTRPELRDSVADLTLSKWGCPRGTLEAHEEHAQHHNYIDTLFTILPTFQRMSILHLKNVHLDERGLRLFQSLNQIHTLFMDAVTITAFGLDETEFLKPFPLAPFHVNVRDLEWHSNLRAAPILNFAHVRHFDTNSCSLLHAAVTYAEISGTIIPLVDVNLCMNPRSYRHMHLAVFNTDYYKRREMTRLVNRLLQRAPRILRLRIPTYLDKGLIELTEVCPLLHSFYGSVRAAKSAVHNRLLTDLTVWTNGKNSEDAEEELKELVLYLMEHGLSLAPVFVYRGLSLIATVLEVLELISPVMGTVEWMELELHEACMTYPYEFAQIFRQYGKYLPLLEHFAFGLFVVHSLAPIDAYKQYACWVPRLAAEWTMYCPQLVSVQLGRLAHWERWTDDHWEGKLLQHSDFWTI
ncbi:hypothetical protein EXIGLDRAFT_759257 [Exidia glandulosa HHB12029]|uniref:Uncharacterized protein n=1 Tax=Exidia glandulosa HHB12029 TaxID=1314781 RepID=A0A165QC50_EXIGL|nr:hypothetical protein EXIGLDRAFT_759257 [Exidia glandulosa HHB12029]